MPEFLTSVSLKAPQQQVYDFLLRPENVLKVSPPDIGLQFVQAPDVIRLGSVIEFKIQAWGQVQVFLHEISELVEPSRIVERQVKGLFKQWIHEHTLATGADGITLVTDKIVFEPPGGLVGMLLTKNRILDHLEDGYFHRHQKMKKLLEG